MSHHPTKSVDMRNLNVEVGSLQIGGTDITATAAEINAIAGGGLSAAELGVLDGVTPGTATASKAVVLDSSKGIATITTATVTTLTAPTIAGTTAHTGRVTTTDGVASGTARVVGGRAYSAVSATDNLLASAGASAHVDFAQTYSIPANTLNQNSVTKIKGSVAVTDASGTDTLEVKLYIGGTTLMTTTAFDPDGTTDFVNFEFDLVSRAAAGAAVSHVGSGRWVSSDGGSLVHGAAILAPTNLATNGALVVKASAKWSSTTANTNARLEMLNVEIE